MANQKWAAHSSVAVVLLIMSLAYSHFVTAEAALALVLGANLGSAINPLLEGVSHSDPANRRLPLGNLINRLAGVLIALPLLPFLAREAAALQPDAAKMTAEFHMSFNVALALIFIGSLDPLAWLLERLLPERKQALCEGANNLPQVSLTHPPGSLRGRIPLCAPLPLFWPCLKLTCHAQREHADLTPDSKAGFKSFIIPV